ncbi:hypothetical protein [Mucilaginibacter sp.]
MSIFSKILKGVGGVALGAASGIVSTASGGVINPKEIISGLKSKPQEAQGAMVVQPQGSTVVQPAERSGLQKVLDSIVGAVNSMNPHVTVTADQQQADNFGKYALIGGGALLLMMLFSNNRR